MSVVRNALNISSSNTDVQLYSVPNGKSLSFTVNICNRTSSKIKIGIALSGTLTPQAYEYVEWNQEVLPGESFVRPGLLLPGGFYVMVRSDTTGVGAALWGYEE